jgi:hypothetical protein
VAEQAAQIDDTAAAPPPDSPETGDPVGDAIAEFVGGNPDSTGREETPTPKPEGQVDDLDRSILDDDPAPAAENTPETDRITVKTLAEKAGVALEDIVFVEDDGDGEGPRETSYADVKRKLAGARQLESDQLAFDQQAQAQQNELLRERQELSQLVSLIPRDAIPADAAEQLQAMFTATATREAEQTLKVIPSWRDPTTMQADREDMAAYAREWGYSSAEIDAIVDHRMLNFLRYHTRLVKRVAELEKAPTRTSKRTRRASKAGSTDKVGQLRGAVERGEMSGSDAVSAFLKSVGM